MADEGGRRSSVGEKDEKTASLENSEGSRMEDCVVLQESEGEPKAALPSDMFYQYEELRSRPVITPGSEIPEDFLHLSHSFGYDSRRRANLQLLDDRTLIYIAGNLLVLLDVSTKEQRFLRSCSGGGIGAVAVCCSGDYFAVAEKGLKPNIVVYEKPSLRPHRVLRGGAKRKFSFVDFNQDGSQLASLAGDPDYTLTIWNWTQEEVVLMCNAFSQEVYRATFSPYNPQVMTSSGAGHIKFWKVSSTFTGLKLKGTMGRFKQTPTTDIKGYVELPDDKVISGSEWGNLLLWAGKTIQVEICRKEGRSCHNGTVQPFSFVDGMLMTAGADGFIRVWNLDRICPTSINSDSCRFQLEPIHEMLVGHNVCLSSVVRSPLSDSFIWFAQDANGAIWKLDLSFLNTARDPECLFSFHTGPIQGLDVSNESHLMATTALDRSVRVFDFLSNRELISSQFTQGGTTLRWAPSSVHQSGGLLVAGFEDGVVRFLELYKPGTLRGAAERSPETAKLRLREAFKPHSAPVTAVAYKQNGLVLATGSSDGTVFFFMVGEKYNPIGFIQVPGPVQALEWSPHREDKLLVLCRSGHVVEVQSPGPETVASSRTFLLSGLPRRFFKFKSIKSQIKRDEEIRRRQAAKEKRRRRRKRKEEEEEEEELPPLHIPDPPSPICCGFYSQPGQFWLSMGGFDAGFLYHCRFSENQDQDLVQRQDEPFDFRILSDTEDDPVCSMTFSSNRQLLLCGMSSGSIRVYPLQPGDHGLTSMQACWSLSVHDNQYGRLRHVRFSHDELFVLTAGDDGNIFSFSLLPPEELQKLPKKAKVPSARVGVESETMALDIENPAAYSLEAAKQKLEKDHLQQESELKLSEEKRQLAELQRKYKQVLIDNQKLPEQFRLTPEELSLDPHFNERFENLKAQRLAEVRKELAGDLERSRIGLRKMQRLNELMGPDIITVVAIRSNHRVSTYGLQALPEPLAWIRAQKEPDPADGEAAPEPRMSRAEPAKDGDKTEEEVRPLPPSEVVRPRQPSEVMRPRQPSEVVRPRQPSEVVRPRQPSEVVRPRQPSEEVRPLPPSEVVRPRQPSEVVRPRQPSEVVRPRQPSEVVRPRQPSEVVRPRQPSEVVRPRQPSEVVRPRQPSEVVRPRQPSEVVRPRQPSEEVRPLPPSEVVRPRQPSEVVRPRQPSEVVRPRQPSEVVRPRQPSEVVRPRQPSQEVRPLPPSEVVRPRQPSEVVRPRPPSEVVRPRQPSEEVRPFPPSGEVRPRPPMARPAQIKRGVRQGMMLRKQAEKAEKAEKTRARIERRKLEWAQIYAAKPPDDYEDPQLAQAIREAEQKIEDADRRRKPEVDSDKKKDELISLQHKIQEKQKEMNSQIVALRDVKVQLLSQLTARRRRLQEVQQRLAARHRLPLPTLFTILPEETPEKRLQPSPAMIKRYWEIRQQRLSTKQEDDAVSILKQLEEEMKAEAQKDEEAQILSASSLTKEEEEEVELTELEKELKRAEEIRLLHEQKCLLQEMDSSICQFDFDLRQLCRLKLRLDYQLKLMELHVLTIFRELLQLRQFQSRDVELQKKLKGCIREEKSITAKLEKCNELLELKTQEITKLEERKEALTAAFQASLGEKNLFKEFLTKVFKKKVKRVKKKEQEQAAEEENKNKEESDLDDSDKRGASVDETVCPEGCEPKLLEYILQLRERRLDLEELLAQEQMVAKAVTEDRESLIKKDKEVKKNRQDVDKDMESINQEKLEKLNQLEVLVPLHLNQIMLNPDGSLPSDLSQMVVVDSEELRRLQEHCHTMETKNIQRREELQRCLLKQKRLLREEKELMATVQKLQLECNEKMMNTFGRLVDLDALQVPPDNRSVEEFKQEKLLLEKAQGKELRMWERRVEEAQEAKMVAIQKHSEVLRTTIHLQKQKTELTAKLNTQQKKMSQRQLLDSRRRSDQESIQNLKKLVKTQSEQAEALRQKIRFLSSKGGQNQRK